MYSNQESVEFTFIISCAVDTYIAFILSVHSYLWLNSFVHFQGIQKSAPTCLHPRPSNAGRQHFLMPLLLLQQNWYSSVGCCVSFFLQFSFLSGHTSIHCMDASISLPLLLGIAPAEKHIRINKHGFILSVKRLALRLFSKYIPVFGVWANHSI